MYGPLVKVVDDTMETEEEEDGKEFLINGGSKALEVGPHSAFASAKGNAASDGAVLHNNKDAYLLYPN